MYPKSPLEAVMNAASRISIAILQTLAIGLWLGACYEDESTDNATPVEDTVSSDVPGQPDVAPDVPLVEDLSQPDLVPEMPLTDTIVEDAPSDVPPPKDILPDVPLLYDAIPDTPGPDQLVHDLPQDVPEVSFPCCLDDEDCQKEGSEGWTCAWGKMQAENPELGRCMGPLDWGEDKCWDNGDCLDDTVCVGAMYCPCDIGCGMADMPGDCTPLEELGDIGDLCGQDGGPCKPGLVCCYPCGIEGCQWKCQEPCDSSEPWCSGGCPMMA